MADNSSILSALKGIDPADAMPFGAAATPEGSPTALSSMLSGLFGMPKRLLGNSANALSTGTYNPAPPMEAALTLAGMGAPMAARGAAGIFGGKLSPVADHKALQEAERMRSGGIHPDEVWRDTNWARYPTDQKWRFEIPDDRAGLNAGAFPLGEGNTLSGRLKLFLDHPDLYKHHPEMQAYPTKVTNDPFRSGMFDNGKLYVSGPTRRDISSVMLHEAQHGVQDINGFSPGADPAHYAGLIEKGLKNRPDKFAAYDFDAIKSQANDLYHKTAGEVEARNVQHRMDWSPLERQKVPPWYSQDVPFSDQLIFDPVKDTLNALRRK